MIKNKNNSIKAEFALFGNLKVLVTAALMVAVSIVCGKVLAFNVGSVLRFSFENMPILLASMAFGPLVGAVTGIAADLIGCLIVGYEINPLVTLGAAAIGLLGGAVYKLCGRLPEIVKIILSVISAHIIGSVVIKTLGLAKFYEISFGLLMLWRLLNYAIIGVLEILLLYHLLRSKGVKNQIERLKQR